MVTFIWVSLMIYAAGTFMGQMITWIEDDSKSNWLRAQNDLITALRRNEDTVYQKRRVAVTAAAYVKTRNRSLFWFFWPVAVPVWLVIYTIKGPKRLYSYYKNLESPYAQARRHMNGEF